MRAINYQIKNNIKPQKIGSILHGAYGDYFEQLLCLADLAKKNSQHTYHLFFENKYRMEEFLKLNIGFADSTLYVDDIGTISVDQYYQFQIFDSELKANVLNKLSLESKEKFDFSYNLLPHIYMNKIQEKKNIRFDLPFTEAGQEAIKDIALSLPEDIFKGKTIGFMWRYRAPNGAVNPIFMPDEEVLREKYSQVLKQAIKEWDCQILVAGMKVKTTNKNKHIVDAKFPEYGLNFEHKNLHYLPGKGWLAEVELITKCDIIICNPSGFSEAIFLKGKECIIVDPPLHYVLKTIKNSFPLFNIGIKSYTQIKTLIRCLFQRHTYKYLNNIINDRFS